MEQRIASRGHRNLFLIAARQPVAGQTKTRLGAGIGMERAAALYRAFLIDLAARFTPAAGSDAGYDLGWAYTPAGIDFAEVLAGLGVLSPPFVRFVPQEGEGWGARQANLLRWGRDHGYDRTVLVASDSPHLAAATPAAAFAALDDHEVVLGRVHDGGYYLIGLRGFQDVFSGVPMSTATASDVLVSRASQLGLKVAEAPATFDVDEPEDVERLIAALAPDGAAAPATWCTLQELGLRVPST